ncbi:MAG: sodium:solute symporter family protein [Phascolarctobacterium sp.]|nr:sodium:solute symporter family protein [Phascolarctobacterium sp.]
MEMSMTHIIFIILALVISLAPGFIAARNIKSADDYSLGGRKSGIGLVAGGIIGTIVGGAATVGTAQLGFKLGLTAWWFTLGSGIALIIMALFYAKPLRQSGLTTVSEFLVLNYGKKAGYLASLSSSFGIFFSVVASTLTGLHLIADIFHLNLYVAGALLVVITSSFVFFGGMSGGGMAGILKIALIFASIAVGGVMAFVNLGGCAGMSATFEPFPWFSLFGRGLNDGLYSLLSMLVGVISTQTYAQAIFSAKDTKTAATGCIIAAFIVIPVGLPSVMIGMFMHAQHPEINAISALPMYLLNYVPDWLGGIGIGALLLSVIGSIGGLALGIATLITRDVVKNIWKTIDNKHSLWVNRILVVASMFAALVFVFFHLDASVLDFNYLSMALRASGIFVPLTFCIFFNGRIQPRWGVLSIACGIFTACAWPYLSPWHISSLFPALLVNLIFLLIGLKQGPSTR